jgi:hypothetical protein
MVESYRVVPRYKFWWYSSIMISYILLTAFKSLNYFKHSSKLFILYILPSRHHDNNCDHIWYDRDTMRKNCARIAPGRLLGRPEASLLTLAVKMREL